jgi:hypothetical protein
LFPAPDRPLENVATRNIFLHDLRRLFFGGVTGSSDIFPEITLNLLLDFEGTRFVNEAVYFEKKIPLPTDP